MAELVKETDMLASPKSELKTFEEWGLGAAPLNTAPTGIPVSKVVAESVACYAKQEEEFVRTYPWLLRPVVRWLRRATRT